MTSDPNSPLSLQSSDKGPAQLATLDQAIDIWKRTVDVQMHFNEISMKIRSFLVTVIVGTVAGLGFLLDRKPILFEIGAFSLMPYPLLFLGSYLAVVTLYFVDQHWYHRLLKGSVKAAEAIETAYKGILPLQLGLEISKSSPVPVSEHPWIAYMIKLGIVSEKNVNTSEDGTKSLGSVGKIQLMYRLTLYTLIAAIILSFFASIRWDGEWAVVVFLRAVNLI